jgi:ParB family transcriptional regulator, chromosome partitioning protein
VSEEGQGRRRGLGRGLSALIADEAEAPQRGVARAGGTRPVPIERLHPGRYQPRRNFDEAQMAALVQSVQSQGILQPLLVRPHPQINDAFEIVAGERRWRAAQLAQLHEVPVVVREVADRDALEIALVENVQRQDLAPLEEAEGYSRLVDEFGHTQEALARALGKSRSHITNMLRLLGLPEPVRRLLDEGSLSAGHARALLGAADPAALAAEVVRRGLNVRQTEDLARARKPEGKGGRRTTAGKFKDADTLALERELTQGLGLKVTITPLGRGGSLEIRYGSLEQLDDLLKRLSYTPGRG